MATGIVVVVLGVLYLPVFQRAITVWRLEDEFSFGFFVPLIAAGLLWLRRGVIQRSLGPGSSLGLVPLLGGLLVLIASARTGIVPLGGVSFAATVLGTAMYLYGRVTARLLCFPVLFLSVSLCFFRNLLNPLGFGLQGLTARSAAAAAMFVGVPVRRLGVDLFVGPFHFVVAEACSGLSSLMALLCLGTLLVSLATASFPRRIALLALLVPIVLVANVLRVTLVLLLAQTFGLAVAQGFIHGLFSAVLFLVALGLFFLAARILKCSPYLGATSSS